MISENLHQLPSGPLSLSILSDNEYRLFRDLIYEECGISLGAEKITFLESRLRRRMDELGIKSGHEYHRLITTTQGRSQELPRLLDSDRSGEDAAEDALLPPDLTRAQLAVGEQASELGTGAGATR